jgi:hypothetical protein
MVRIAARLQTTSDNEPRPRILRPQRRTLFLFAER